MGKKVTRRKFLRSVGITAGAIGFNGLTLAGISSSSAQELILLQREVRQDIASAGRRLGGRPG